MLDALEGQGPRRVEPERLEVSCHHLHRGDPARDHGGHEVLSRGEGVGLPRAPEPQPHGVGEVRDVGSPRGRDVEDAGAGQGVLQAQPGDALLRGRGAAPRAVRGAGGVCHRVRLVEGDHALEVGAAPLHELLQPRAARPAHRAQRGVGHEEDAAAERDGLVGLPPLQGHDVGGGAAEVGPVAHRVLNERPGLGEPHRAGAPGEPAGEDDARDLAALARPGAVAEEVALAVGDPARGAIARGGGLDPGPVVRDGEPARQVGGVGRLGHDDRLELRRRQPAGRDDGRGQGRAAAVREGRRGRCDGRHGDALDEGRGVLHRDLDLNPLRGVAGVDVRDGLVRARRGVDGVGDRRGGGRTGWCDRLGRAAAALRGNGPRPHGRGHGRRRAGHARGALGQPRADGVQRGLQPVHRLGKDRPRVRRPAVVEAVGDEQRRLHARAHLAIHAARQDEVQARRDALGEPRPEDGLARGAGREREDRHETPAGDQPLGH